MRASMEKNRKATHANSEGQYSKGGSLNNSFDINNLAKQVVSDLFSGERKSPYLMPLQKQVSQNKFMMEGYNRPPQYPQNSSATQTQFTRDARQADGDNDKENTDSNQYNQEIIRDIEQTMQPRQIIGLPADSGSFQDVSRAPIVGSQPKAEYLGTTVRSSHPTLLKQEDSSENYIK